MHYVYEDAADHRYTLAVGANTPGEERFHLVARNGEKVAAIILNNDDAPALAAAVLQAAGYNR